ncbi:MAG TPA: YfhO family protein, partial [Gemmatimonadaceae bacterium]|nr:YfhO family protein [Gemmatimonadaceae bacterium]
TLGAWRSFIVVALTAGALMALGRARLSGSVACLALLGIVGLDLWSIGRLYWRFSPRASELYASDAAIAYLRAIPQPGRVVPLALGPLGGPVLDPYLRGGDGRADGLMVHGVRSAVGYHGNELGRYDLLTGWDDDWPRRLTNPNLRRLTNIRYLYTAAATPPLEGMRLVAGPTTNAAGNTVYLYEFPEDNPLAWVVPIAIEAPDANVLATVLDRGFDVRRAALFDTGAAVPVQPVPSSPPALTEITVRVTHWEPGRIALSLDRPSPAGAALLVSENYYPGWSARVDGKSAPIGRADYTLIGVALPAGARQVELTFTSPRYVFGKRLTIIAIALAAIWFALGLWRRRGHSVPRVSDRPAIGE